MVTRLHAERIFDNCEEDHGQYDTPEQIFWATGAALFVKSKIFHEVNGFDEYFFAHQEEIDLCWSMQLAGYKIYVEPQSVVYHVGGGTLPKGNSQKSISQFQEQPDNDDEKFTIFGSFMENPRSDIFRCILLHAKDWLTVIQVYIISIASGPYAFVKWTFIGKEEQTCPKIKMKSLEPVYKGYCMAVFYKKEKNIF